MKYFKLTTVRSYILNNNRFNIDYRGFTLLELMIALAIIASSVAVILHTVNYHADIMHENIITTQMYQLAKEKMMDLEKSRKNLKGSIKESGFQYETTVITSEDSDIVELRTIVRNSKKTVMLNEFVLKKDEDQS